MHWRYSQLFQIFHVPYTGDMDVFGQPSFSLFMWVCIVRLYWDTLYNLESNNQTVTADLSSCPSLLARLFEEFLNKKVKLLISMVNVAQKLQTNFADPRSLPMLQPVMLFEGCLSIFGKNQITLFNCRLSCGVEK